MDGGVWKLSWGRGRVRRGGNAIIWRLCFRHLGWDTPKARLGQDYWLENLHMLFPYCLGFLPTWQLGSERKSPDSKHSKQGQQHDSQHAKSFQSCLTLCDRMDSSPSGSSVHGILQARILEWITMPPSRWLAGLNAKWKCGVPCSKTRKNMPVGVPKYKTFSSSLSTCHDVFYLLLTVVPSKGKLKFYIISINFTVHLYVVQWQ